MSAGAGAKGERWYDWLRLPVGDPERPGWKRYLLIRRKINQPSKITPYICFAQQGTTLQALVTVAGKRWTVEQCFEIAKQEVGLDEYEVRSYQGWYRHITLACLAHAFLTVLRANGLDPLAEPKKKPLLRPVPWPPSNSSGGLSPLDRIRNTALPVALMVGPPPSARGNLCLVSLAQTSPGYRYVLPL